LISERRRRGTHPKTYFGALLLGGSTAGFLVPINGFDPVQGLGCGIGLVVVFAVWERYQLVDASGAKNPPTSRFAIYSPTVGSLVPLFREINQGSSVALVVEKLPSHQRLTVK
jgi:hypothetical protein